MRYLVQVRMGRWFPVVPTDGQSKYFRTRKEAEAFMAHVRKGCDAFKLRIVEVDSNEAM